MSTLFVAIILIGVVVGICVLLLSIHNKQKREAAGRMLRHLELAAKENNLNFSSQELFHNAALGLDGIKSKLLAVVREGNQYTSSVFDLKEVEKVVLKKIYSAGSSRQWRDYERDLSLEKLVLFFEVYNKPPVEVTFYDYNVNHISELKQLEQKAKYWETILSKLRVPVINGT